MVNVKASLPAGDPRAKVASSTRKRVQSRLRSESALLASILDQADKGGTDASVAAQAVLSGVISQQQDWQTLLASALTTAAVAGAKPVAKAVHKLDKSAPDYDSSDPDSELQDIIESAVPAMASGIVQTTHSALDDLFNTILGATAVAAVSDLLSALQGYYSQAASDDGRASVIGDTTAVMGYEAGALDASNQCTAGTTVTVQRQWSATEDDKTRDAHSDADGQVVDVGQPFTVGGESLMYPGDPTGSIGNTANCRCTVSYLLSNGNQDADQDQLGQMSRRLSRLARKGRRDRFRQFREATLT